MNKLVIKIAIVVSALIVLVACSDDSSEKTSSNSDSTQSIDSLSIKVSTEAAETNIRVKQLEELNYILNDESDGKIDLSIYSSGQLFGDLEAIQEVSAGSLDAAQTFTGPIANLVPELNVLDLPFLFKDNETYQNFLWNTEFGAYLIERMNEHNLMPIAFWDPGNVVTVLSKNAGSPPKKPDDLKGLVITDSQIPSYNKALTAFGATATSMPIEDAIPGIAQGTLDGIFAGYSNWYALFPEKETAPFALNMPVKYTWLVTVNKQWFDELPEEFQTAIIDSGKKSEEWQHEFIYDMEAESIEKLKELGKEWYVVPPEEEDIWMERLIPIYKEYEEEYGIEFMKLAYEASGKGLEYWNELGLGLD